MMDGTSTDANTSEFDGLLANIADALGVTDPTGTARAFAQHRADLLADGPSDDDELAAFRDSLTPPARPASSGLLDLRSLRAQPLPPREWLENGIFELFAVNKLTAASGSGKSLLLLHMAVNWSLGRSALDLDDAGQPRALDRPLRVLYIDGELGPRWWHRYLDKIGAPDELPDLHVVTLTDDAPTFDALCTPHGAAQFRDFATELADELGGIDIVIVDTLSAFVGGEENSNDTWAEFDRLVTLPLKKLGFTLVYADHTGHGGDRARGGSAKKAKLDVEWVLTVPDAEMDPNRLELSSEPTKGKMRSGHEGHPMKVILQRVDGPLGHVRVPTSQAASILPTEVLADEFRALLADQPAGMGRTELIAATTVKVRRETKRAVLDRLVAAGQVAETDESRSGVRTKIYRLVSAP